MMTISANNAVPEFKQLLATTRDPNGIETASKLMSDIIRNKIRYSLGDEGYASALEALSVMRDQLIAYEEPKLYNDFVTKLRSSIRDDVDGGLGGDRREMWYLVRKHRLGLIHSLESELVDVTEDDARSVSPLSKQPPRPCSFFFWGGGLSSLCFSVLPRNRSCETVRLGQVRSGRAWYE